MLDSTRLCSFAISLATEDGFSTPSLKTTMYLPGTYSCPFCADTLYDAAMVPTSNKVIVKLKINFLTIAQLLWANILLKDDQIFISSYFNFIMCNFKMSQNYVTKNCFAKFNLVFVARIM